MFIDVRRCYYIIGCVVICLRFSYIFAYSRAFSKILITFSYILLVYILKRRLYNSIFTAGGKPSTRLLGDYMFQHKSANKLRLYNSRFAASGKPSTKLPGDYKFYINRHTNGKQLYASRFAAGGKPSTKLIWDWMLPDKSTHKLRTYSSRLYGHTCGDYILPDSINTPVATLLFQVLTLCANVARWLKEWCNTFANIWR